MRLRRILAGIGITIIAAVGVSVSHATPVAARSCNTSWTTVQDSNSFVGWWTFSVFNSADGLAYIERNDGRGGCDIQYAERFSTDHTSYYYVGIRIWVCGSYNSYLSNNAPLGPTGDTGWYYSQWISYGSCNRQADNYLTTNSNSTWAPTNGGVGTEPFQYLHV
jgi:hypothetical protein